MLITIEGDLLRFTPSRVIISRGVHSAWPCQRAALLLLSRDLEIRPSPLFRLLHVLGSLLRSVIVCCIALTGEILGELILEPFRSPACRRLYPSPAVRRTCLRYITRAILGSQVCYLNLIARQLWLNLAMVRFSLSLRGVVLNHGAVSLRAVSNPTVNLNTVCRGQITVFGSLCATLLAHLQALVDVAHIDGLQLKLFPTTWSALCRLIIPSH